MNKKLKIVEKRWTKKILSEGDSSEARKVFFAHLFSTIFHF